MKRWTAIGLYMLLAVLRLAVNVAMERLEDYIWPPPPEGP